MIPDEKLLRFYPSPMAGDDGEVRANSVKVIVTRRSHSCVSLTESNPHIIRAGSRVVCEKAVVDGDWFTWYTCVPCILEWAKEIGEL